MLAAEEGRSLSALLTDCLEALIRERKAFDRARRRAPARLHAGMDARQFVDMNILMYAHDVSAGAKHQRAKALVEELWRTRSGVVSTQVLQELCVNLRRKAGRPLELRATGPCVW